MAKEILIADSDRSIQDEFQRIFETSEYRLIFSESGDDALQQIKFFKPDLVIAGTSLSEKNGAQLCKVVKSDPDFKHIPFILLSELFEEVSEEDRERCKADGIISKPLQEGAILNLVDRMMEEEIMKKKDEPSVGDLEKTDEEEVIELLDVVEEPESTGKIEDFMAPEKEGKEQPLPEIDSLEPWEKELDQGEKPSEAEILLSLAERERELEEKGEAYEGEVDELKEKAETPVEKPSEKIPERPPERPSEKVSEKLSEKPSEKPSFQPKKEAGAGEDFFDKVELEEILERVEKLKPELEKELLAEEEISIPEGASLPEEPLSLSEDTSEVAEKAFSLEEFETALEKDVTAEPTEEDFKSLFAELRSAEAPELTPFEIPPEKKEPGVPPEQPLVEEAPQEILSEEGLPEIGVLQEELLQPELVQEEIPQEGMTPSISVPEAGLEEEELTELPEEEFPEALLDEEALPGQIEGLMQPMPEKAEHLQAMEERVDIPGPAEEKLEALEAEQVPVGVLEEREEKVVELREAETLKAPEIQAIEPPKEEFFEVPRAGGIPPLAADKRIEEVIAHGIQEMMQDFVTKIVPEMTQDLMRTTVERIEKMVREIVPEIAEKAIQEEIERLKKEEKD